MLNTFLMYSNISLEIDHMRQSGVGENSWVRTLAAVTTHVQNNVAIEEGSLWSFPSSDM